MESQGNKEELVKSTDQNPAPEKDDLLDLCKQFVALKNKSFESKAILLQKQNE